MAFLLKMYHVTVRGYPPTPYPALTPSKARADAWRSYTTCYDCSFGEFLKFSTVRRADPPANFGEKIAVSGKPAYRVTGVHSGQYVAFVYDNSDVILRSHPLDVSAVEAPEKERAA